MGLLPARDPFLRVPALTTSGSHLAPPLALVIASIFHPSSMIEWLGPEQSLQGRQLWFFILFVLHLEDGTIFVFCFLFFSCKKKVVGFLKKENNHNRLLPPRNQRRLEWGWKIHPTLKCTDGLRTILIRGNHFWACTHVCVCVSAFTFLTAKSSALDATKPPEKNNIYVYIYIYFSSLFWEDCSTPLRGNVCSFEFFLFCFVSFCCLRSLFLKGQICKSV